MAEEILFPDAEGIVITALRAALTAHSRTCSVSGSIPATRSNDLEYVTVQRTGGPKRDMVTDSPSLTFECWASTGSNASSLANLVRAIVHSWRGSVAGSMTVYRVQEFAGPVYLPDPVSKQARYTFTASLDVRGHAI